MQNLLRKFDLFILDWDGTLSTSTIIVRLSNKFKKRYNPDYINKHIEDYKYKKEIDPTMELEMEEHRFISSMYWVYGLILRQRLREGTLLLLNELKRAGKRVAIFSDARSPNLAQQLKRMKLAQYFDIVLTSDMINAYKPSPLGLKLIIRKLHAKEQKSIYIGDMGSDVLTADLAGIASCGVGGGLDAFSRLKSTNPDYLFKSMEELARSL